MDRIEETDLISAACAGDPQLLQHLLAEKANPDLGPLLIEATFCSSLRPDGRHTEVLRLLLDRGADVDVCDSAGRRPLHFAAMRANVEQLRLLLAKGAEPNPPESNTGNPPLLWASGVGSLESVSLLLDHGAAVNLRNPADCATALHRAAANGHLEVVRKLAERGADPNLTDIQGKTPLGRALQNGHEDVAQFLRTIGAREGGEPSASCHPSEGFVVKGCRPVEPASREAQAKQAVLSAEDLLSRVRRLMARWERETGTLLSMEIGLEAQAQLAQLLGTGCWPDAEEELAARCRQVLGGDEGLYPPLKAFFNEALTQAAARPLPLFHRVAAAVEPDLAARLGWPPTGALNRYRCADLPERLRGSTVSIAEQGSVRTLDSPVKRICMLPGRVTLVAKDSSTPTTHLLLVDAGFNTLAQITEITPEVALQVSEILPSLDWFCPDPQGMTSPIAQSQGRDAIPPAREQQAPFRNAAVGRVTLSDPGHLCSDQCRDALAQKVVEAIQLWRSGCSDCVGSTLQGLEVDGRIFLARPLIDRLLLMSGRRVDAFLTGTPREIAEASLASAEAPEGESEALLNLGSFAYSGGFGYIAVAAAPYQRIERSSALAEQLCGKLAGTSSDAGQAIRWLLCGPRDPAKPCPACVGVDLTLGERITLGCSDDSETLACAAADRGIELNCRDVRFEGLSAPRLTSGGLEQTQIAFGKGSEPVDIFPVLVHEVGHWFGLPHLDDSRTTTNGRVNVMSPASNTNGHCITAGNMRMLNHAANQTWPFRLLNCGGFRRSQTQRKEPR
jgi:hypothetical protein